ncbi:MAG: hypothetical protein ACJ8LN_03430 [Sulfurifustis sp.]
MAIDSSDRSLRSTSEDGALVTYTDTHLAHGIGEALRHAYHGELDSQWNRRRRAVAHIMDAMTVFGQ